MLVSDFIILILLTFWINSKLCILTFFLMYCPIDFHYSSITLNKDFCFCGRYQSISNSVLENPDHLNSLNLQYVCLSHCRWGECSGNLFENSYYFCKATGSEITQSALTYRMLQASPWFTPKNQIGFFHWRLDYCRKKAWWPTNVYDSHMFSSSR